jgi:hypothetical protein
MVNTAWAPVPFEPTARCRQRGSPARAAMLSRRLPRLSAAAPRGRRCRWTAQQLRGPAAPAAAAWCRPYTAGAGATPPAPDVVVGDDGRAVEGWGGTSKHFLATHPRGAYTTARTVRNGAAVFELDAHIERTAESLRLMHGGATPPTALDAALDPAAFRERFVCSMLAAVRCFYAQSDRAAREARLTVLATWEDDALRMYCHAGELPPPPPSPVAVEVRGAPRSAAAAKVRRVIARASPTTRPRRAEAAAAASPNRGRLLAVSRTAHGSQRDRDWSSYGAPMSMKSSCATLAGSCWKVRRRTSMPCTTARCGQPTTACWRAPCGI